MQMIALQTAPAENYLIKLIRMEINESKVNSFGWKSNES